MALVAGGLELVVIRAACVADEVEEFPRLYECACRQFRKRGDDDCLVHIDNRLHIWRYALELVLEIVPVVFAHIDCAQLPYLLVSLEQKSLWRGIVMVERHKDCAEKRHEDDSYDKAVELCSNLHLSKRYPMPN